MSVIADARAHLQEELAEKRKKERETSGRSR